MLRLGIACLVILIGIVQYRIWFSDVGVLERAKLEARLARLKSVRAHPDAVQEGGSEQDSELDSLRRRLREAISERASGESAWFLLGLPGAAYALGMTQYWDVIGIALGTASVSLKILLGVDRSFLGSEKD